LGIYFSESSDGLTVTQLGHGFHILQDSFILNQLRTESRFTDGVTITDAACNTAYNSAPNLLNSYSGTLIEDELFCIENTPGTRQVCEVSVDYFIVVKSELLITVLLTVYVCLVD